MSKKRKSRRHPAQLLRFGGKLFSYAETCKTQACADRAKKGIHARGWYFRAIPRSDGTDIYLSKPAKADKYGDLIHKGGRMDEYGVLIRRK